MMDRNRLLNLALLLILFSVSNSQTLYSFQSTSYSVDEGDLVLITVQRTSTDVEPRSIIVILQNGTDDFMGLSQVATFQPIELTSQVTFASRDDNIAEPMEVFDVSLVSTGSQVVLENPQTATITIAANDNAAGIFSFQDTSILTLSEGETVELNISRTAGNFYDVMLNILVEANNQDILMSNNGSILFSPGEIWKTVMLTVIDDNIPENDETYRITLHTDHPHTAVQDATIQIVVLKNDAPIRFAQETYFVAEKEMQAEIFLQVMRGRLHLGEDIIGPVDSQLIVEYLVSAHTARSNQDFLLTNGTLVFAPNVLVGNISVVILPDDIPELSEQFTVTLTSADAQSVLVSPNVATVIISANDDQHGVISLDPNEGDPMYINEDQPVSSVIVTVRREGGTYGQIVVQFNVSVSDEVLSGLVPMSGTVTLSDGESSGIISLEAIEDVIPEVSSEFTLTLTSVSGGARLGELLQRTVIIQDSDIAHGAVQWRTGAHSFYTSQLPRYITWTVEREGGTIGDVAVTFICSYSENGVVVPGTLTSDRPYQVVILDGDGHSTVSVQIKNSSFLSVGGIFEVTIDEVKLLTDTAVPSFNSPYKGIARTDRLVVGLRNANGEIGFAVLNDVYITEPDSGTNKVSVPLSREGTSGTAAVSWRIEPGHGSSINSTDVSTLSGVAVLLDGSSVTNIEVEVVADDFSETDESMVLVLVDVQPSDTQKLRQNFTEISLIIRENDNPGGVFHISSGNHTVQEGESLSLTIERTGGDLVPRTILYDVTPNGNDDFFGATGLLAFDTGERVKSIQLIIVNDDIPELDETFTFFIRSYGEPSSVVGVEASVDILIKANDSPYGQFYFIPNSFYTLFESKGGNLSSVQIPVMRDGGKFGTIAVSWESVEMSSKDLSPVSGTVLFAAGEDVAFIEITSLPDDLPEGQEEFTIYLTSVSPAAEIVSSNFTTVAIVKNDAAVFFQHPAKVEVEEGGTARLTVTRTDSTKAASVSYRSVNASALPDDYEQVMGQLMLNIGQSEAIIDINIIDDTTPESMEFFYVELYGLEGDIVLYNASRAVIMIHANDDANGIFRFGGPYNVRVEEGDRLVLGILRDRGTFGVATLEWRLRFNGSQIVSRGEFESVEGHLVFADGQAEQNLELLVLADGIPEYDKTYVVELVNVTGGDYSSISTVHDSVTVTVVTNDDPKGVLVFHPHSVELSVAEDYIEGEGNSTRVMFSILRQQGLFDDIQVLWEVYSAQIAGIMPPLADLLFLSDHGAQLYPVDVRGTMSGGVVYNFTGETESYAILRTEYQPHWVAEDFAISVWIHPFPDCNGTILTKASATISQSIYYSLRVQADSNGLPTTVTLSVQDQQTMELTEIDVPYVRVSESDDFTNPQWHLVLINVGGDVADFIFDGILATQRMIPAARADDDGLMLIGSAISDDRYVGLMGSLRIYSRKLSPVEISEIFQHPAHLDVEPITGVSHLAAGQLSASFSLKTLQDVEAESNEVFSIKLISSKGGARISNEHSIAKLTVLKSDNANGLFSFEGPCQPFVQADEGMTLYCGVKRTRGDAGTVTLTWHITQLINNVSIADQGDFNISMGQVMFYPGQLRAEIRVHPLKDSLPELREYFNIELVSADASDGQGTTPTSGASIDSTAAKAYIELLANDLPNGLLQFSSSLEPVQSKNISVATSEPEIEVSEGIGTVAILVERAQGLIGDVEVEWRTVDGTAKSVGVSQPDYVGGAGQLLFKDGQRYSSVSIPIIDDVVPEDDKSFLVKLLNPTGGAAIGLGATITVSISHSDDAYGVFQFDHVSLTKLVTEEDNGVNSIVLNVVRSGGLIGNALIAWKILDDDNSDFLSQAGTVEFVDGESEANIVATVRSDVIPELDEVFQIQLVNASKGRLGEREFLKSTVTILANDDPYGIFIVPEEYRIIRAAESVAEVSLTITRTMGRAGEVDVQYRTMPADHYSVYYPTGIIRANSSDYIPLLNASVVFQPHETNKSIAVLLREDNLPEADEYIFVQLLSATLLTGGQQRSLAGSPRIGSGTASIAQIIIEANDNANGILQLSRSRVSVNEGDNSAILYVERSAGFFGEVMVRFEVVAGNATASSDYYFTSNNVVLSDQEQIKQLPIYIHDDSFPELSEVFTVRLLPHITGGATLGEITECLVIILPSDDPHGAFEFSTPSLTIEEPEVGIKEIDIAVNRLGGTMDIVAVQWIASTETGELAEDDVEPSFGTIHFTSNQGSQNINIGVKADTIPEILEVITLNLTLATNGGRIGSNRLFQLSILTNDNPHGTVGFFSAEYKLIESEETSVQNVTVHRSGGLFGDLLVYYSTSMVDLPVLAGGMTPTPSDYLWFYHSAVDGHADIAGQAIDRSDQSNPLQSCAEYCLVEKLCTSFEMDQGTLICTWYSTDISDGSIKPTMSVVTFYRKMENRVSYLYNSQAQQGSDYQGVRSMLAVINDGESIAQLGITVFADLQPELNEKFNVIIDRVQLVDGPPLSQKNAPTIADEATAIVIISSNDDANGIFKIYSRDPRALDGGQRVLVEEREYFSVELVVERTGGTIGDVSVVWAVDHSASNASRDSDYIADGATLTFLNGDAFKAITIGIEDDTVPEYDEVLVVHLSDPQGGSLIDNIRDQVSVVIQANDHVAGVIGFNSSSYIAREGEDINVEIWRTEPAAGVVSVLWVIQGVNNHMPGQNFISTEGVAEFVEGQTSLVLTLRVLSDDVPEVNEEYQLLVINVTTEGISVSGAAIADVQSSVASITVEASDDPHGVFSFASGSLNLEVVETDGNERYLVVDRKFGSIGGVRVYYDVTSGHLADLDEELVEAVSGEDFVSTNQYVDIANGQKSGYLPLTIVDDTTPEVREVFLVNLTGVELLHIEGNSQYQPRLDVSNTLTQVFIVANDGTRGQLEFPTEYLTLAVNESSTVLQVSVWRAYGTYGDVSVFIYSQTSYNALLDQDYEFTAHEVHFKTGESLKTVNITIIDDVLPEGDEMFDLVLASPKGGATLGDHISKITILENDGAGGVIQFASNSSVTLQETFSPGGYPTSVSLQLTRGPGLFGEIEAEFVIIDSTGNVTSDITPSSGSIIFVELQSLAVLDLTVVDDHAPEFAEYFIVELSAPFSSLIGENMRMGILVLPSDAPNGLLNIMTLNNQTEIDIEEEDNSNVHCQVYRTSGLLGDISVTVETSSHTATARPGSDIYLATQQVLDFEATGYCSRGNYLLALNGTSSELLKWDGRYQHVMYVGSDNPFKCMMYNISDNMYFILINAGPESYIYVIMGDDSIQLIDTLTTQSPVDAALFVENNVSYLAIVTVVYQNGAPLASLEKYVISQNGVERTGQLVLSTPATITVFDSLAAIVQRDSVQLYNIAENSWTLEQTLHVMDVLDVAGGSLGSQIVMLMVMEDSIQVYLFDRSAFTQVSAMPYMGVHAVSSFRLVGNLFFIISSSSGTSIMQWSGFELKKVWSDLLLDSLTPLSAPEQMSDSVLLASMEANSPIYAIAALDEPDYIPRTLTLEFREGETMKEFSVLVINDNLPEDTEFFDIVLTEADGGAVIGADNSVRINILANDNAHGLIQFSEDSRELRVSEESVDYVVPFTLVRDGGLFGRVSVMWTASGDIDLSSDISPTSGTVEFSSGQAMAQLSVTVRPDGTAEGDEYINITLTRVVLSGSELPDRGAAIGEASSAILLILANESPYGIVRWDKQTVIVAEPDELDDIVLPLSIVREQGTLGNLQISYITSRDLLSPSNEQATSGQDYVFTQQLVNMAENETRVTIDIVIKADDLPEIEEQFLVNITSVRLVDSVDADVQPGIRLNGDVLAVVIAENDNARGIVQFDVTRNAEGRVDVSESPEEDTPLRLRVIREVGHFGEIGVLWQILPREASADDVSAISGMVRFLEDEREAFIELFIRADDIPETIETFDVQLISVSGGASLGVSRSVRVAILKNDSPTGLFGFRQTLLSVSESDVLVERSASIEVERLYGYQGAVNIHWQLEVEAIADFEEPHSGSLTFQPGERLKRFTLKVKLDNVLEGEESFKVSITSADNNADLSLSNRQAEIIIVANVGSGGHIKVVNDYRTVVVAEPNPLYNGQQTIMLSRGVGIYGEVSVTWAIQPAYSSSFASTEGVVVFEDRQELVEVVLQTVDNAVPELRREFTFLVTSATGSATISQEESKANIIYAASDFPFGLFGFDSTAPIYVSENSSSIVLTITRVLGLVGEVEVGYVTSSGSAQSNDDYIHHSDTLIFSTGQQTRSISIGILEDVVPERPETFFVNLTSIRLLSMSQDVNFTQLNGFQLDVPPQISSSNVKSVIIDKNDNAEGTIEFDLPSTSVHVKESDGIASLTVTRGPGSYGDVGVTFEVLPASATANQDFFLEDGKLLLGDGVLTNYINVTIADDGVREMSEFFVVSLTSVEGGAKLGSRTTAYITIAKSNYPNGKFGFLPPFERRVINPDNSFSLHLSLTRTEGLAGRQTLTWLILGPNSLTPLVSTDDIAYVNDENQEVVNGQFSWLDGEGGSKSLSLLIKAFSGWEVQKEFTIVISEVQNDMETAQNGEVDPLASQVTVIISKNGDPNGIIQLTAASRIEQQFDEPANGMNQVRYFAERLEGNLGEQEIFWEIIGAGEDISPSSGSLLMASGVSLSTITFNILADDVPELTEVFQLHLVNVIGGATVKANSSRSTFSVRYNDDPHGVFELLEDAQAVLVGEVNLKRSLHLKVNRHAGIYGSVRVIVGVSFTQESSLFPLSKSITFVDDQHEGEIIVDLNEDLFIELDSYFTVEINEVVYLGGPMITSPPRVGAGSTATLAIPALAGNSYLFFDNKFTKVKEEDHMASLKIKRIGLYGNIQIEWKQGYVGRDRIPSGFAVGTLSPSAGRVLITHGESYVLFNVTLLPTSLDQTPSVYVASLQDTLSTNAAGGARLGSSNVEIELEPYGVIGFTKRAVEVGETQGYVSLVIQRIYGSQRNIQVTYSTMSGTALAENDFSSVSTHRVVMMEGDLTKEITIPILLDPVAEQDEHFIVMLENVNALPTTDDMMSPRLSDIYSNVTVIIRANGDPYGLLDVVVSPASIPEADQSQVSVRVRRNAGTYGYVTVQLRTVGGGEAWDSQIALLPKTDYNNSISEALSNRDSRQSATAASDYMILNEKVVFEEGEVEKEFLLSILEDNQPESDELVFIYLTAVTGGARIAAGESDGKKYGYAVLTITRNDVWNGVIEYAAESRNVTVDEDGTGTVTLALIRSSSAEFTYDTTVQWEAVFAIEPTRASNLVETNGLVVCPSLQGTCEFEIRLVKDETPEFGYSFPVRLFNPGAGARVNAENSVAIVTVLSSDSPYGIVEFEQSLVVEDRNNAELVVEVIRKQGATHRISVFYETESIVTDNLYRAGRRLYSAVEGIDYNKTTGYLVFESGVVSQKITVKLMEQFTTSSSYPRVFKLVLSEPMYGAVLGSFVDCTVLLVNSDEVDFWVTQVAASVQEMDDFTIEYLLDALLSKDFTRLKEDAMIVVENILNLVVDEGTRPLSSSIRQKLITIFCKLMNPEVAVTRGRLSVTKLFERFLFTLLVGEPCEIELNPYPALSCDYFRFSVVSVLTHRVSNYLFSSSTRNSLKLGDIDLPPSTNDSCTSVQFIEYNNVHWFNTATLQLLDDKVLAVNIDSQIGTSSVTYKIFTPNGRRTDKRAQCVYYDEQAESWTGSSSVCRVKNSLELGTSDAVECQCDHMSSYAVSSETRDKMFIGYPTYMLIIAGLCMMCLLIALLVYLIFPTTGLFTLKLVIHQLASTFCLLGLYLLSAYLSPDTSPDQILVVGDEESNFKCIITGLLMHYFLLAQFIWILAQSINLWLIFIKNDEHTNRFHRYYMIMGYGFPALFVGGFYGITYSIYLQHNLNSNNIYGDINNEQEMCFLTNQYAALAGVVAPVVVCAIGVLIFLGEIGSQSKLWSSYDDIFKGRPNKGEIWPIAFLWLITLLACIAGGLHMAYNYNWMMITFCACLVLLSLFVVSYFAILRGPCSRSKDSKEDSSVSAEQYQSTLIVNTGEELSQLPQIDFPSPNTVNKHRELLDTAPRQQPWEDSESDDGLLNSTMIQRTPSVSFEYSSSLSRRAELTAEEEDTRDLGELIMALKEDRPQSSMAGRINLGLASTDDDESEDTETHQGAYDVFQRVNIADTHL